MLWEAWIDGSYVYLLLPCTWKEASFWLYGVIPYMYQHIFLFGPNFLKKKQNFISTWQISGYVPRRRRVFNNILSESVIRICSPRNESRRVSSESHGFVLRNDFFGWDGRHTTRGFPRGGVLSTSFGVLAYANSGGKISAISKSSTSKRSIWLRKLVYD